jgi:hypothetical protein
MNGIVVLFVVLVLATAFGLWRRRVDGRIRDTAASGPVPVADDDPEVEMDAADIDAADGELLDAGELDAEAHLELVRRLDIRRTPTVLILDPEGIVRKRASGLPRKADVIAAVGSVTGPANPSQ